MKSFYSEAPVIIPYEEKRLLEAADALRRMHPHPRGTIVLLTNMMASEAEQATNALATRLAYKLHKVDLNKIASKYIGETEKNLREMLKGASSLETILFFDEADALFGKRSEVKDAHDRFVNLEISRLLSLLESHQGIVALTVKSSTPIVRARNRRRITVVKGTGRER